LGCGVSSGVLECLWVDQSSDNEDAHNRVVETVICIPTFLRPHNMAGLKITTASIPWRAQMVGWWLTTPPFSFRTQKFKTLLARSSKFLQPPQHHCNLFVLCAEGENYETYTCATALSAAALVREGTCRKWGHAYVSVIVTPDKLENQLQSEAQIAAAVNHPAKKRKDQKQGRNSRRSCLAVNYRKHRHWHVY
jgi:hypothetical protein